MLLPTDGAALTEIAIEAMEAGIPVINVDREFSSPFAARATILGDNYGMGVSAGTYICEQLGDNPDAIVAEIAGIDSLPLTQDRSQGFADALDDCGLEVAARVAADFTVAGGEAAASQLLSANPQIDAIWNHDDDQGVGVLAAIDAAGRDEFFMVGGAGSKSAMEAIEAGDTVLEATVIYPSTQAADGVALARLIAQGKTMSDLDHARHPEPDRARRSRRDEGQRRPVHRPRVRVDTRSSRGVRRHDGRPAPTTREDTGLTEQASRRHDRPRLHGRGTLPGLASRPPILRPRRSSPR